MNRQKFSVDFSDKNDLKGHINLLQKQLDSLEKTNKTTILRFDSASLEDCLKAKNTINSFIGQIKSQRNESKKDRLKRQFASCTRIWDSDISHLYEECNLDETKCYYVYAHCEPNTIASGKDGRTTFGATIGMTHIPFYIGKGTGNRAYELNRNETHRKVRQRLSDFGKEVVVTIVKDGLTEKEALMYESKLIDIFGIIGKGGRLVNLDEGVNFKERRNIYKEDLIHINTYYKELL